MMYEKVVARRYAKGLMLASNPEDFAQILSELNELLAMLKQSDDLAQVFIDPAFLPNERKGVLKKLAEKITIMPVLLNFLLLLTDKGRFYLLEEIAFELARFIDEKTGRIEAVISSASTLSEHEIDSITKALAVMSNKTVRARTIVDESLLGGIRVEMASMILDGTVKAKLLAMKDQLLGV